MFELIAKHFTDIGARLTVQPVRNLRRDTRYDLDIRNDKAGEHYLLRYIDTALDLRLLQADRAGRHLLMWAEGERLLCGHDERHWFVAAVGARVSTVSAAKKALLPQSLLDQDLPPEIVALRHNAVFLRQGEWFFVPSPRDLTGIPILKNEPLIRGRGSKAHVVSEIVRFGGTAVVLSGRNEFTPEQWEEHRKSHPHARGQNLMKDPEVYARGKVRHPDHATLVLKDWHRVYPNREARSINVSFYD